MNYVRDRTATNFHVVDCLGMTTVGHGRIAVPHQGVSDVNTGGRWETGALRACAIFLVSMMTVAAFPAEAAGTGAKGSRAAAASAKTVPAVVADTTDRQPETTSAVSVSSDPACQRSRKRLWVDGEGWVVRRVTTCF
jgi:hypothetical protein